MQKPSVLRPPLRKLAANPSVVSARRLWQALTVNERERAVTATIDGEHAKAVREAWAAFIASERRFRTQTIERWDDARIAAAAAKLNAADANLAWLAILALHTTERSAMVGHFLNDIGIERPPGQFFDEDLPRELLEPQVVLPAVSALCGAYPLDDVAIYLLVLRLNWGTALPGVDEFLTAFVRELEKVEVTEPVPVPESVGVHDPASPLPVDVTGFTTLDRRLIISVVDTAAGVMGAPTLEELDDLLLELEQLNGRRHQTFFHLGLRDALFGRPIAEAFSAENESRRRWYYAGFVSGLARRAAWQEICGHFDKVSAVRSLGADSDGPADAAAHLVFQALIEAARYGEAAAFAKLPAVAQSSRLRHTMLQVAVELIRRHRAAEARPLLDTLWSVTESRRDELDDADLNFAVEVQRRRALCLRQLGETREALALLQPLAELSDPVVSAVARTDIGLVRAGFRRLGEIALPSTESDLGSFIDALKEGEGDWRTATATKGFRPAHANFALGVLALARQDAAEASYRLDAALSFFSGSPDIYRTDGTLSLAQLYLGVSICLGLEDTGRLPRAHELIEAGLDGGARLPVYLVRTTIDALALARSDLAHQTASVILERCGEGVLDELVASSAAADAAPVRNALFRRAASPSRPAPKRVEDYRTVLPWLLSSQDVERARDALEFLESAAHAGVGRTEFVQLLRDPEGVSPAWDEDRAAQASVSLLEAEGRYTEAACELAAVAHRLLASSDQSALDDVVLVLSRLEDYGSLCDASVDQLKAVVDARIKRREIAEDTENGTDTVHNVDVRILIVGGSESQMRMENDIRAAISSALPGVSLDFLYTGWSGNWTAYAEQFRRRVSHADGVVMLQMMRTTLGWTIRANCHVPWRGCRGNGQGEIINTIKRVVPMARSHLLGQAPGNNLVVPVRERA